MLSLITPPSIGVYTFFFSLLFLVGEAVLRRSFSLEQALQIPFTLLFSACIDGFMRPPSSTAPIPFRCSTCCWDWGVMLEVCGGVTMLPGEALVRAVSQRSGIPFHRVKVVFDSALTLAAACVALLAFGRLNGVKEGTVAAALLVGQLVDLYQKRFGPRLEQLLVSAPVQT